jgi:hypothetical protein
MSSEESPDRRRAIPTQRGGKRQKLGGVLQRLGACPILVLIFIFLFILGLAPGRGLQGRAPPDRRAGASSRIPQGGCPVGGGHVLRLRPSPPGTVAGLQGGGIVPVNPRAQDQWHSITRNGTPRGVAWAS